MDREAMSLPPLPPGVTGYDPLPKWSSMPEDEQVIGPCHLDWEVPPIRDMCSSQGCCGTAIANSVRLIRRSDWGTKFLQRRCFCADHLAARRRWVQDGQVVMWRHRDEDSAAEAVSSDAEPTL